MKRYDGKYAVLTQKKYQSEWSKNAKKRTRHEPEGLHLSNRGCATHEFNNIRGITQSGDT